MNVITLVGNICNDLELLDSKGNSEAGTQILPPRQNVQQSANFGAMDVQPNYVDMTMIAIFLSDGVRK